MVKKENNVLLEDMSDEELVTHLVAEEARILEEGKCAKKEGDEDDDDSKEDDIDSLDEADAKTIQMSVNDKGTMRTAQGLIKVVVLKTGSARYEVQEVGADGNPTGLPFKVNKIKVTPAFLSDLDFTEDLEVLMNSDETLTEDFKAKSAIIFETALSARLRKEKEILAEQYQVALHEETEGLLESLGEKLDKYLTFAVESWVNANTVAIDTSLRAEIAESFMGSLKTLFVEHYVDVPESKRDLFEELEQTNAELAETVASTTAATIALTEELQGFRRKEIIAEASVGLADTQAARLVELVEDTEFVDEETFAKRVKTIREAYFTARRMTTPDYVSKKNAKVTTIVEGFETEPDPIMAATLAALKRSR